MPISLGKLGGASSARRRRHLFLLANDWALLSSPLPEKGVKRTRRAGGIDAGHTVCPLSFLYVTCARVMPQLGGYNLPQVAPEFRVSRLTGLCLPGAVAKRSSATAISPFFDRDSSLSWHVFDQTQHLLGSHGHGDQGDEERKGQSS